MFYINEKNRRSANFDTHFLAEPTVFHDVEDGKPFEMRVSFTMYGLEDSMRLFMAFSNKECETSLISGFPCRILKEHDCEKLSTPRNEKDTNISLDHPLARGGSNNKRASQRASSQRPPHRRTASFYSAKSAASSASSLSGIFRGSIGSVRSKPNDVA